jgi:hypothetical protein
MFVVVRGRLESGEHNVHGSVLTALRRISDAAGKAASGKRQAAVVLRSGAAPYDAEM